MSSSFDWQKTYPSAVSRTLDPSGKSISTVVALHDRQITDADINLIQDNQDYKRRRQLEDQVTSGCLTYTPFQFQPLTSNTFYVPSFDILFNGEVVTIQGQDSAAQNLNAIILNPPSFWAPGVTAPDSAIYIVFVEVWYQALNPITGAGYYIDPISGNRYFFPYGGISPSSNNAEVAPDDSIDPFQGLFTTERAQIQWNINVQPVALTYNFSKYQFGLDPGAIPTEIVYAQASQPNPLNTSSIYQFTNMGSISGDTGVWRAGDGNVNNSLGTMDGYSYAFPLAVVYQLNSGYFSITQNALGCANPVPPYPIPAGQVNGLLSSGISGRFDSRLADQIFQDQVIDTRSIIQLSGYDMDALCRYGFGDLVQGKTQLALSRGQSPGCSSEVVGSALPYYTAMAPSAIANTNTVGSWDGFANGFSSDQRTFTSTQAISINQKTLGTNGSPWISGPPQGDAFTISLPTSSSANISAVTVTALNTTNGVTSPAALLQGQIAINGLGSKSVTIQLTEPLGGTPFDPQSNNLYATVSVTYPAGSGIDLRQVPYIIDGGQLFDNTSGITMPVYGCSEYDVQAPQLALQAYQVWAVSPEYSDIVFGTKIWLALPGSQGVQQTVGGNTTTTFIISRLDLNESVNGLYATKAWDLASQTQYVITSRVMNGTNFILTVQNAVPPSSTIIVSMLAANTAQLNYNAPVRGVTEVEETVLMGNYTTDPNFVMDPRITVVPFGANSFNATANTTTVVLAANNCTIKGIAGDDVNRLIWISDGTGNLNAVQLQSATFSNGIITAVAPGNLTVAPANAFFFCGSILPAFDPNSSLVVEMHYVPYQGEGVLNRNYEFVHAEDNALITTNGTGAAPIVGLADVYPYNRELPIALMLPSQVSWNDAGLANTPLATFFDSNYVAMRVNNVEHTFLAPMHTNDFIPPVDRDIRKQVQFVTTGGRGFATAIPHLGFAIATPTARTVLGQNLQSTTAPITLYVNNATGNDSNDGLSLNAAKLTILSAMSELPPVLRHPCVVELVDNGQPYIIANLQNSLEQISLGDGISQSSVAYALANLSRVVQDEGRLVISVQSGSSNQVTIQWDTTPPSGFAGFGNGPTYAFYLDTSRAIFNGLLFSGFPGITIKAKNSDVQFVNCSWVDNLQAGSYEEACGVILDSCSIDLGNAGVGHVGTGGTLISATSVSLTVDAGATPGQFFLVEYASSLNLQTHSTSNLEETNITASVIVAQAELNSSIVVTSDFQTNGSAILEANSTLARTVSTNPFLGGVTVDDTSGIVTQL